MIKLTDGLRIRLVKGFYDGEKTEKNYQACGLWVAGRIPLGAVGTVRRAPKELVPGGSRDADGNPNYWPWCVVWDDYPAKKGYYYSLANARNDESLDDKWEVVQEETHVAPESEQPAVLPPGGQPPEDLP